MVTVWHKQDENMYPVFEPHYTSWVPQPTIVLLFTTSIPWWPQLTPRLLDWLAALWSEKQICLRVSIKKKHGRSEVKIYLLSQIFFNLFWRKKKVNWPFKHESPFLDGPGRQLQVSIWRHPEAGDGGGAREKMAVLRCRRDPCGVICLILTYFSVFYADYVVIQYVLIPAYSDRWVFCISTPF